MSYDNRIHAEHDPMDFKKRKPPRMRKPLRSRLTPRKKKPMKFKGIAKDSYGRRYGVDHSGTFWRLDKLDFHETPYTVSRKGH